jgi:hypothetical protein
MIAGVTFSRAQILHELGRVTAFVGAERQVPSEQPSDLCHEVRILNSRPQIYMRRCCWSAEATDAKRVALLIGIEAKTKAAEEADEVRRQALGRSTYKNRRVKRPS